MKRASRLQSASLLLVYAGFFVVLELVLWAFGVDRLIDREDPFRGFSGLVSVFERDGDVFRTRRGMEGTFHSQSFLAEKPEGGLRIFTLGGSSAYGFPWGAEVSFTGVLGDALSASEPGRSIEAINVAGVSYAMHRLNLVADELVDYEPDVFVVYSGHNEFIEPEFFDALERRSQVRNRIEYGLAHTRVYSGLRQLLRRQRRDAGAEATGEFRLVVERDSSHRYTQDQKREVADEFRWRLARLVTKAQERGVKVVLATVPANLRDWQPDAILTEGVLSERERRAWNAEFDAGRSALERGELMEAADALQRALSVRPDHAEAHYLSGRALEGLERWDEARLAYERACDLDASPQRRTSAINQAIRSVAAERGALLVDADTLFESESRHGLVGFDWIEDYVHPTPGGHQRIAWEIWEAMARAGWLRGAAQRDIFDRVVAARPPPTTTANPVWLFNQGVVLEHQGRDEQAVEKYHQALSLNPSYDGPLGNLAMLEAESGRWEESAQLLERFVEVRPERMGARLKLAETWLRLGRPERARDQVQAVLDRHPDSAEARVQLATVFSATGQVDAARAEYERALSLRPDYGTAHHNLGQLLFGQGQIEKSWHHLLRAAELSPERTDTRFTLGLVAERRGQPGEAVLQYREALSRNPGHLAAQNNLAWLLATSSDASLRDAEAALLWARRAAERTKYENVTSLDTLAAACAEAGRFDEAIAWQSKLLERVADSDRGPYEARLAGYRAGRPHRVEP